LKKLNVRRNPLVGDALLGNSALWRILALPNKNR
jgi:hypothetical protein